MILDLTSPRPPRARAHPYLDFDDGDDLRRYTSSSYYTGRYLSNHSALPSSVLEQRQDTREVKDWIHQKRFDEDNNEDVGCGSTESVRSFIPFAAHRFGMHAEDYDTKEYEILCRERQMSVASMFFTEESLLICSSISWHGIMEHCALSMVS